MELIKNDKYNQAIQIHNNIISSAELFVFSLCEMCKNLKQMRDLNLYSALGYETFDDYCEKMANIKSRQAYNYISTYERLGEPFLQSNAKLGITKLELLAQLPEPERDELINDGGIDGLSVREIRRIIEDHKKATEQLTIFSDEITELKESNEYLKSQNDERDKLDEELQSAKAEAMRAQKELEELKKKPITAQVVEKTIDEDKIRKDIEKELKSKQKDVIKTEVDKEVKKAIADAQKTAEDNTKHAAEKAKNEVEKQFTEKMAELDKIRIAAEEKAANLEKQLKMSDTTLTTVKLYFDIIRDSFNKLTENIKKADDSQQAKLKEAAKKLLMACIESL